MNRTIAAMTTAAGVMLGAVLSSGAAQAQKAPYPGKPYAEAGYSWLTLSSDGHDVSAGDLVARMGLDFTRYLGGEVFGATSSSAGNIGGVSYKFDNAYGAYLKLHIDTAPDLELFARAGWVRSTLRASYYGIEASISDDSFSYGVGMQFTFADKWYLQGDIMSYYNKHGNSVYGPSVSVGYRF